MRRGRGNDNNYKVMIIDDDIGIIDSTSILLNRKEHSKVENQDLKMHRAVIPKEESFPSCHWTPGETDYCS